MRIVHLNFTFRQGGIPVLLADITNEQVIENQVSIVIINNQVHNDVLEEVGKNVHSYQLKRPPGSKNPYYILKLNLLLNHLRPDVIHCHGENCIKFLFPIYRHKAVLTFHDTQLACREYYSKYKKHFSISKSVQDDVLNRMNIGSELIYNGINLDKIKVRKSVGRNKIFKMVQIGRLVSEKKGQELSIKALDKIVHEYNICNLKLDFIGWGKDLERLKQMVSEHSLNDYVSFLGLKSREYIYSQLCEYDLMIHPSLYEGFGLNVAESMAAKVPVLVSDIDGPMEIIDQGRYGYHFKAGSISDFSKGIVNVINHFGTNCQKKMIEDASCYVQNNFDVKITSQSYVDAYGTIENS